MHPDNGGNSMNYSVYAYADKNKIEFSRSRPYKKNDHCFVEQKNSTHVRNVVGYLRYDTEEKRLIVITLDQKEELKKIYKTLNPAELKRKIDEKLKQLYRAYKKKAGLLVEKSQIISKKMLTTNV